jgi:hypothetical protein
VEQRSFELDHPSGSGRLDEWLHQNGWHALADGGFEKRRQVLLPWAEDDLVTVPLDVYDARIEYNEKFSHVRARVEHAFSAVRLNSFACFGFWRRVPDVFLRDCLACALIAMNMETLSRHGTGGMYGALPPIPGPSVTFQKGRYPHAGEPKQAQKERQNKSQLPSSVPLDQPLITAWVTSGSQMAPVPHEAA